MGSFGFSMFSVARSENENANEKQKELPEGPRPESRDKLLGHPQAVTTSVPFRFLSPFSEESERCTCSLSTTAGIRSSFRPEREIEELTDRKRRS